MHNTSNLKRYSAQYPRQQSDTHTSNQGREQGKTIRGDNLAEARGHDTVINGLISVSKILSPQPDHWVAGRVLTSGSGQTEQHHLTGKQVKEPLTGHPYSANSHRDVNTELGYEHSVNLNPLDAVAPPLIKASAR